MLHRVKSQLQLQSKNFYWRPVLVILLCGALITVQYLNNKHDISFLYICAMVPV